MKIPDITNKIFSALENKYVDCNHETVRSLIISTVAGLNKTMSADEIVAAGRPTSDFKSDVINQTKCFYLIENYLRHDSPKDKLIEIIYATVLGIQQMDIMLRQTQYVEDYSGSVIESTENITPNLSLLNQQLKNVHSIINATIEEKTAFLSKIFSGIIRTHPFQDGNGRVARMVIQFCLRYWGYLYIVIPKVRNNDVWKRALTKSIDQDYKEMQLFFMNEMKKDRTLD